MRVRSALLTLPLLLVLAPAATGESMTVQGTGDIDKMAVKNGDRAVITKVFGLSEPCEAQYLEVVIFWGKKKAYEASAGCYSGTWAKGLYYQPNRNKPETGMPVGCDKFKIVYNAKRGFYRVVVGRTCLKSAPDKLRVRSEGHDFGTLTGGAAGPTKALRRG